MDRAEVRSVVTTLAGFLLARIAEDETTARSAPGYDEDEFWWLPSYAQPDRVLAQCAAKRRIVDEAQEQLAKPGNDPDDGMADLVFDRVLRLLAQPYADHSDYDPEWKP